MEKEIDVWAEKIGVDKWTPCKCPVCGATFRRDSKMSHADTSALGYYREHVFHMRRIEDSKGEHGSWYDPVPPPIQ